MADVTSKGKHETTLLKQNIEDQLNRLLSQLEDLEELRDEFTPAEYEETRTETIDQLREFESFLAKSMSGDLTLMDTFGAAQLAIQAAVSSAFKTPEVIRLFAQRQPDQLRVRLESIRRDHKMKKLDHRLYTRQAVEILNALKSMNEKLAGDEIEFLEQHGNASSLGALEDANASVAEDTQSNLLKQASKDIAKAAI